MLTAGPRAPDAKKLLRQVGGRRVGTGYPRYEAAKDFAGALLSIRGEGPNLGRQIRQRIA